MRVASGVRYDLALPDPKALRAYTSEFTGGQMKVAPEHIVDGVLRLMRKPGRGQFEKFLQEFRGYSSAAGKEQYVVPYLISGFPGCTDQDMRELADWLRRQGWSPRQVQCFIPTPGTVATAMFYAGIDPEGRPLPVARTDAERLRQHGILMPDRGRKPAPPPDRRATPPPDRRSAPRTDRGRPSGPGRGGRTGPGRGR